MSTSRASVIAGLVVGWLPFGSGSAQTRPTGEMVQGTTYLDYEVPDNLCHGFTIVHELRARPLYVSDGLRPSGLSPVFIRRAVRPLPGLDLLDLSDALPVIEGLEPGSPAALAGIAEGDSVVALNGAPRAQDEYHAWNDSAGTTNVIRIKRGTVTRDVSFTLGRWLTPPADTAANRQKASAPPFHACRPIS